MRLSRQRKRGSAGTADAVQSRLEKVFKLAGESTSLNVFSRDEKGRLQYVDSIPLSDVTASTFLDVIKEAYGGGRFQIVPMGGNGKAGESFEVSVYGESKLKKKPRADQDSAGKGKNRAAKDIDELKQKIEEMEAEKREDRVIQAIQSLGEKIQSTDGKKDISVTEVMESVSTTVKNLQASVPQGPDPIQYVSQLADLIFKLERGSRAPVSTTGPASTGGGIANFLASVIAELEKKYLGGMAAMSATGGPPPALAPAGAGFAGTPETSPEQTGSFPGAATEQQAATEQPPAIDESQSILPGFDLRSLGIDPETRLRELLASRHDPEETAVIIVYLLDFLGQFAVPDSQIAIYIESFFTYPAAMFDQVAPLVAELRGASAEYLSDLREAIVKEVGEYTRQRAQEAAARSVAQAAADEGEKKTLTPEQRQAQEEQSREREAADEKVDDEEPNVEDREAESEAREGAQQS